MKKLFLISILLFTIMLTSSFVSGQDNHTAREEAEGKIIWGKLQTKQLECKDITNDNYAALGEYFMGQSVGDTSRHTTMNEMMKKMMGEQGEEQMHIVMGKRLSGCDTTSNNQWRGGALSMMGNFYGNMMNNGWGLFGGLTWILVVVFLLLGIVFFWKEITKEKRR